MKKEPIRVLLLEDNPGDARLFREFLLEDDLVQVELDHVDRLKTGLEHLTQGKPDVILLDLGLPDSQGQETFTQVYSQAQDVPIVVLTGLDDAEQAVEAVRAGAQDYLVKGEVTGGLLMRAIRYAIERKRAEEELRESEDRYRDLVENSQDLICTHDLEGKILSVNLSASKMLGYEAGEFVNRNIGDILEPGFKDAFQDYLAEISKEGCASGFLRVKTRAGETRIWEYNNNLRIEGVNEPVVRGMARDVTERLKAEKALRQSEKMYRILFENMLEGVYRVTPQGQIITANPALVRMLGYDSEADLKQIPITNTYVYPSDREEFKKRIAETNEVLTTELRLKRKDGSQIVALDHARAVPDGQGNVLFFEGTLTDITERKQAEEALRESEASLQGILRSTADGILAVNRENKVLFANERFAEMWMIPQEIIASKDDATLLQYVLDQLVDPQSFLQKVHELYKSNEVSFDTLYFKDGRVFDRLSRPLMQETELRGRVWSFRDITERKQTEEEIRRRLSELEMLYASSLALNKLLQPKEIGQRIIKTLSDRVQWRDITLRQYHPATETLELLAFNKPGLENEAERLAAEERLRTMITRPGQGIVGWVIQHGQPVYCGDVTKDQRYLEVWPGIRSGMYAPLKIGERTIGCLSVESEQVNAFSETDEWLLVTLATQAASALENARVFEETRQRLAELETVDRISIALRTALKQDEMLEIVLEEMLAALNAADGSINLLNDVTGKLHKTITRGWLSEFTESIQPGEGIFGTVFSSGNTYITPDFVNDPLIRPEWREQLPSGWGGACVPIRSANQMLGVLLIAVPGERELSKDELRLLNTLAEMTGNALHRMRLHEETERRLEQLQALHSIDLAINASADLRVTLGVLVNQVTSQLKVDAASVLLLNPHAQTLEYAAGCGFHTSLAQTARMRLGESYAGRAALERRAVRVDDPAQIQESPNFAALWAGEGFAAYYGVPLIAKGQIIGVLQVFHRARLDPDPEWVGFFETLAQQAAIAIDNTQLFDSLQRSNAELSLAYDVTIEGWSHALDLRDKETEGHSLRVTEMTLMLARVMGISEAEIVHIRRGALLHDIGKMGVPDTILLKPDKLTDDEWVIIQRHPKYAFDMLSPIAYLKPALDIPFCHHEKWDGTGYPRGLKGEQIPLAARLFAVVDVWDALRSDRPYRAAWPEEQALEHIKTGSGAHFDPKVVELFIEMISKKSK